MPEQKERKRDRFLRVIGLHGHKKSPALSPTSSTDDGGSSAISACPSINQSTVSVPRNSETVSIQDASNLLETTSCQPEVEDPQTSPASDLTISQRLWNKAYDNLQSEEVTEELMKSYMQTLENVLLDKEEPDANISAKLADPTAR